MINFKNAHIIFKSVKYNTILPIAQRVSPYVISVVPVFINNEYLYFKHHL